MVRGWAAMLGYRQLDKKKNANDSLTTTDKGKLSSVHILRTQAFLLIPKPPLYPLWCYHNFNLPVYAQQWPH